MLIPVRGAGVVLVEAQGTARAAAAPVVAGHRADRAFGLLLHLLGYVAQQPRLSVIGFFTGALRPDRAGVGQTLAEGEFLSVFPARVLHSGRRKFADR
jgi:hypothetical protein